jgi:autotransporter-associated beta strand protein
LGASTGVLLEFNNVTNHAAATLAPNNLAAAGTMNINVNSGLFFAIGETFPLLSWNSGTAPAVNLAFLAGAGGHLVTNGNQIDLVIDDPPYIWTGAAGDFTWNTTSIDWTRSGVPVTWVDGHYALFDDTSSITNLTLSGTITPTNATINNSASPYAITNSPGNVIGGPGSLIKAGNGTLMLPGGANTYTGPTTLAGGMTIVNVLANGGSPSDIGAANNGSANIVFSGGTLQYTGPGAGIDRLFSVGPGGGTIDNESTAAGALVLNNPGPLRMVGNGPRGLILTGPGTSGDTLACALTNHPAGTSLTKNGTGLWILTGTNSYAGGTALLAGNLQIGAGAVGTGGPSGSLGNGSVLTVAGTIIDFLRTGTLTVPGGISGGGSVALDGSGTVILANNNTYNGGTTINTGTLQLGNGGGTGSLLGSAGIVDNSLLVFNTGGSFVYSGAGGIISGTGNVIVQGGGFIKAIGNNTYTGWTRIDANTTLQPSEGQDGALASSVVTNNGTLRLTRQNAFTYAGNIYGNSGRLQIGANNFNPGTMNLTGTSMVFSNGIFIGDNELILGDGITPLSGSMTGNVTFVNNFTTVDDNLRRLTFNRLDDFTFGWNITTNFTSPQGNQGIVQLNGAATVTLTGNNTYAGGTVVNGGALAIGNGGGSGSVGSGPVTINNNNNALPLVINRTGTLTIPGVISGTMNVVKLGSGALFLNGVNTYTGTTTVTNGTLGGSGTIAAPVTLAPGTTLAPGPAANSVGTLTVNSDLSIGGNVSIAVNKSLSPSNSMVVVSGALTSTGTGTLTVNNVGPQFTVGDRFVVFSQPVANVAVLPSANATWINNLAVDGSIQVATLTLVVYQGLTNSVLGGAGLNLVSNQVTAFNLGSSGQDGVSIGMPATLLGLDAHLQQLDPSSSLPVGAYIRQALIGTSNGIPNSVLGTVTATKTGPTNISVTADFSPSGASTYSIQAYYKGTLLAQASNQTAAASIQIYNGPNYPCIFCPPWPWSWGWNYWGWWPYWYWPYWHYPYYPIPNRYPLDLYWDWWQYPVYVSINAGPIVLTDHLYLSADNVQLASPPTALNLVATQVPSLTVINENANYRYGSLAATALGNATETPLSTSTTNALMIGNIGSSGQDGVSVAIPTNLSLVDMQIAQLDVSNSLPVGAYLQQQVLGTANGITNGVLGTVTAIKTGPTNISVTADFSPSGASTYSIQAYYQGTLVAQASNQTAAATMQIINGPNYPCIECPPWPWSWGWGYWGCWPYWGYWGCWHYPFYPYPNRYPIDLFWDWWRYPIYVSINAGPIVLTDHLYLSADNVQLASPPAAVQLTASQVPALTVSAAAVTPVVMTSSQTSSNLILQWAGTGNLQTKTNINSTTTWSAVSGASSPYTVNIIKTNRQFYRVTQPSP